MLGEFERNTNLSFTRIYPAAGTQNYDKFFEAPRINNKLLHKYLFENTDLSNICDMSCFNDLTETAPGAKKS